MHTDANVSSSISFESLNFAVIFPHWYGTTSEKIQVTAYFTETSGIAECKRLICYILSLFSQRKMQTFVTIVLWWYRCSIAQKVYYAIDKCKLYIYKLFNYSSGLMKGITTFCRKLFYLYDLWYLKFELKEIEFSALYFLRYHSYMILRCMSLNEINKISQNKGCLRISAIIYSLNNFWTN